MKRLAAAVVLAGALLLAVSSTASAEGEPQGPVTQEWLCVFDVDPVSGAPTWHCVPPGVLKNLGGPSAPSLNFEGTPGTPGDVSFGPPEGTTFVGTENLIRIDLYAGQPCPQGTSGEITLPFGTYHFCHHYGD
jgi:hypothetical protein